MIRSEFKFCIGDDDAALLGIAPLGQVNPHIQRADLLGGIRADHLRGLFKRDVDVVPGFGLGGRSKNRLRQFGRFNQAGRQANAANGLALLIFLPP